MGDRDVTGLCSIKYTAKQELSNQNPLKAIKNLFGVVEEAISLIRDNIAGSVGDVIDSVGDSIRDVVDGVKNIMDTILYRRNSILLYYPPHQPKKCKSKCSYTFICEGFFTQFTSFSFVKAVVV
ncbi:MAG: hypothetical protein LUH15_11805 [Tannerellaceae bacterium]|nr:hypothetical protein [Tannerellaceae bacterium]